MTQWDWVQSTCCPNVASTCLLILGQTCSAWRLIVRPIVFRICLPGQVAGVLSPFSKSGAVRRLAGKSSPWSLLWQERLPGVPLASPSQAHSLEPSVPSQGSSLGCCCWLSCAPVSCRQMTPGRLGFGWWHLAAPPDPTCCRESCVSLLDTSWNVS